MFELLFQETQWNLKLLWDFSQSLSWSGGPKWTRFSAEKPRRLQQSTGLLPRAGFRVHFTELSILQALRFEPSFPILEVVGQNGLEPSTSRLSVVCSSQLSYWPILVEISGIEPLTSCLQGRRSPSWAKPPYLSPVLKFHSIIVNCQLSIVNYFYVCTL